MRIKRVLQGTALTALAAAAWMGTGVADASAAEATNPFPVNKVEVSLYGEHYSQDGSPSIHVEAPEGAKEIMFGVATYNASKGVKIADTAWDVYDVEDKDGVTIDLSKLSIKKDNYVAVKSESTDPIYIKIGASVTNQKIKYDAATNKLNIEIKKSANPDVKVENVKWEYRTSVGNWNDVPCHKTNENGYIIYDENGNKVYDKDATMFQEYQPQGATLYVRAGAKQIYNKETGSYLTKIKDGVKDAAVKQNPPTYDLYDAGLMPGKETKVNIAKQANGPSVSADYVKGAVNIPAKTEYRVIASGCAISKIEDNGSKGSKTVIELLKLSDPNGTATSGVIEVRKKAEKKAASKWTRVAIENPEKIALSTIEGVESGKAVITTTSAVTVAEGITMQGVAKGNGSYSGSINVTVASTSKYGITVQVGSAKAVTVKNDGKAKKIKAAVGTEIKIAKAGDKKAKTWASDYITVGSASDK